MSRQAPTVFVLAGGTGGHVYPALAVALELRARGYEPRWIGTERGLESRVVPAKDIPLHCLPMRGLRGKNLQQQVLAFLTLGVSLLASFWLLLRFRPSVVIGMGGYASFPGALAAWCLRRPLLLQEQNAVAGSANRALARFAQAIAVGFPGVFSSNATTRYLGNPVRDDLLPVAQLSPWAWAAERPLCVLVLGGSLGAQPLNEALPKAAQALGERCEWRHQSGPGHAQITEHAYAMGDSVHCTVSPYVEDMAAAYAWADLVVCRAGALTVAELAVTGRPAILIPLPHAIDDHQTANARFLEEAGAAILLPQSELDNRLVSELTALIETPTRLAAMASAALGAARPNASREIADLAEAISR